MIVTMVFVVNQHLLLVSGKKHPLQIIDLLNYDGVCLTAAVKQVIKWGMVTQ